MGRCENCLKDACLQCSKEVWIHSTSCIKKREKFVMGILEVDHECWFADLSEKIETPIFLKSFIDKKDPYLGTHSGEIAIKSSDKTRAINNILKHKQIVELKPLYANKQIILRTRALFNKSVDEQVRKNKSILLNPIEAHKTKERNLVISPSINEMRNLTRTLNEFGNCKVVNYEEMDSGRINSPKTKEIKSFVRLVNKKDLDIAMQRMRLIKRFY